MKCYLLSEEILNLIESMQNALLFTPHLARYQRRVIHDYPAQYEMFRKEGTIEHTRKERN